MSSYLITGCGRGLGAALVAELATRPTSAVSTIFATLRGEEPQMLAQMAKSWPERVIIVRMDTTDENSVVEAAKKVEKKLDGKGLDYLINNAGVGSYSPAGLSDVNNLNEIFNVNVSGTQRVTQAFLPAVQRGDRKTIVNVPTILSSIQLAKLYKDAPSHAYKISKTALNMLTALYAQDFPGLIFIAANPGWLRTELGGGSMADLPVEVGAEKLLEVINAATRENSGKLINIRVPGWENKDVGHSYDGEDIPW